MATSQQPSMVQAKSKLIKKCIAGVTGHPLNQPDYLSTDLEEQVALISKMGMCYYRMDIVILPGVVMLNEERFIKLYKLASAKGIKILPMIYLDGFSYDLTEARAFESGQSFGLRFAEKYGKFFDYYEMGNELELGIVKPGKSGSDYADYQEDKLAVLASFLKGLDKGLKLKDPSAKTMVNTAGWFHFVFLEMLKQRGVGFDITAYHWYDEMDHYSKSVKIDIISTLVDRLKMPVWFTEVNCLRMSDNAKADNARRLKFLSSFIKRCELQPMVEALLVYELLDEANLSSPDKNEKQYGLLRRDTVSASWIYKDFSKSLFVKK